MIANQKQVKEKEYVEKNIIDLMFIFSILCACFIAIAIINHITGIYINFFYIIGISCLIIITLSIIFKNKNKDKIALLILYLSLFSVVITTITLYY